MPKQAITDQEIENCFPIMSQLRPHLEKQSFVAQVRQLETEGFRLAYIQDQDHVVCVAGYRIYSNLFMGKNLYVDDLVTDERARSTGYGQRMLVWLRNLARDQACRVMHLDSGTHRPSAHKFYFHQGMVITSFHFAEKLSVE